MQARNTKTQSLHATYCSTASGLCRIVWLCIAPQLPATARYAARVHHQGVCTRTAKQLLRSGPYDASRRTHKS